MNNEGTKLIIPQIHADIQQRPKTTLQQNYQGKLFRGKEIDQEAKNYDIYTNDEKKCNTILVRDSPSLLALKNKSNVIKAKTRPVTVKPVKGHKNRERSALDYVSILTPGQKARPLPNLAVATQKMNEESAECERMTLDFKEDPVAYFSKHKDGSGHLFIYLVFTKSRDDPDFDPYDIVKVPHSEIKSEYFTMSATGVTHICADGDNETVTLDRWSFETACFGAIRKLRFFKWFRQWKQFQLWKNYIHYMRFSMTRNKVKKMNIFSKRIFIRAAVDIFKTNCKSIILKYLLPFKAQRKFSLNQYLLEVNKNKEKLTREYRNYLHEILDLIHDLDADIRDPDRVTVKYNDVDHHEKMFPDLGYLREAKEKMKIMKEKLDKEVHEEVMDFSNFVRFADYVILESLQEYCYLCWKNAEKEITSSMSSIFEVEVSFTKDGEVTFNPSINDLKNNIALTLDQSLIILDNLPRIVRYKDFRPHLRERYGNINELYEKGPTFKLCVDFNPEYKKIKETILKSVEESYESARAHSQGFKEFFELFQIGKVWNADDYIKKRGGQSIKFNLLNYADDFDRESTDLIFDPSEELFVDLRVINDDLMKFKEEDAKITQFIACTVQGAIYIDSKSLRQALTPIPIRSINAMKTSLTKLLEKKIMHITAIFKFCMRRLKKEPDNLKEFADNLAFNALTKEISPYLETEISFIDDLTSLLASVVYHAGTESIARCSLRSTQKQFIVDQAIAENISEQHHQHFTAELQRDIIQISKEILRFQNSINDAPKSIQGISIDETIEGGVELVDKIHNIEPRVKELDRAQKIIDIDIYDFGEYDSVKEQANQLLDIYDVIKQWMNIWEIITTTTFSSINITQFVKMVQDLDFTIENLKRKTDLPLLNDVAEKVATIVPLLGSIQKLATRNMNFTHWNMLFETCGYPKGYYAQIKIDEMLQMHIFDNVEAIDSITETALGENELNSEYGVLLKHWKEVKIPLDETKQVTEDTLMIGDIAPLLAEIDDSKIQVQRMLEGKFAKGVKQQVLSLGALLENFSLVLEAWKVFQDNWIVLNVFFAKEETRHTFPQLSTQFTAVRRRWMSLVHHASGNLTLFHICEFSSLLEMLKEINQSQISILEGVMKNIDIKRHLFPRLFFLSNMEVLKLFSTTDFDVFNQIISRVFMHIKRLEVHNLDGTEIEAAKNSSEQTFNKIKICGILGEDDEMLPLSKNLICNGGIETWGKPLLSMMKKSMFQSINDGILKYKKNTKGLWFESITSYTMFIVYQIMFTRDVEECFDNFENNVRSFTDHLAYLQDRQSDLCDSILDINNNKIFSKIRLAITIINNQILILQDLCNAHPGSERKNIWDLALKISFKPQSTTINVNFADKQWIYGFEFWGRVKPLIICQHTRCAIENICNAMYDNLVPFVSGESGNGKKEIISNIAQNFGKFILFSPGFKDDSGVSILRMIVGGIESKSWISLNKIQNNNETTLTMLGDIIQTYKDNIGNQVQFEIGNYKVKSTSGFSLFIGGNDSSKIPYYLRKALQPIFINNPDIYSITKINLRATGYQKVEDLAQKLIICTQRITSLFDYIPNKSVLSTVSEIIKISSKMLWETHMLNEDYVLSRAVFINFKTNAKDEHLTPIAQIIYSLFRAGDSFEEFKETAMKETIRTLDQRIAKITENIKEQDDYIHNKVKDLLYNFFTKKCVVIYGPPYSGKSTIIKYMVDAINSTEGEMHTKIYSIHHAVSTIEGIFGKFRYSKDGHVFKKGIIANIFKLINESNNQHSIIKFDGPITKEFSDVLYEMTTTTANNRIAFIDQQKFSCDNVTIIVETDNIKNIAPNAALNTGFIPVSCTQLQTHDLLPVFERNLSFNTLKHNELEILKKTFLEDTPTIAMYIMKEQSIIANDEASYIYDILPEKALRYAFLYLDTPDNDRTPNQIRYAMLQALYIIYSSLFTPFEALDLSKWFCDKFNIVLPQDWAPFNIKRPYWNSFPTPSLASCVLQGESFIPYDSSIVDIVYKVKHFSKKILLPEDVRAIQPSCIPMLYQMEKWFLLKQPIIISGPLNCGKSYFLDYLFSFYPDFTPINIPIDSSSTQETMETYIMNHINFLKKEGEGGVEMPKVAFVFDNVDPSNTYALEYIRSLFSKKKQSLLHFNIFVTTRASISDFPIRFLSRFVPFSIPEQSIYTKKFIFQAVANYLGVSKDYIKAANVFMERFIGAFHYTRILDCISITQEKGNPLNSSSLTPIRIILAEMRFLLTHKLVGENFRKFSSLFHSTFLDPTIQSIFQSVSSGESLEMPEFDENGKNRLIYAPKAKNLYREELEFMLHMNLTPVELQQDLHFFTPVINNFVFLVRAACLPGGSCILKGKNGCGRKTLCRFLAITKEMSFYEIADQSIETIKKDLSELVKDILLKDAKVLIFARYEKLNASQISFIHNLRTFHDVSSFFEISKYEQLLNRFSETGVAHETKYQINCEVCDKIAERMHFFVTIPEKLDISSTIRSLPIVDFCSNTAEFARQCINELFELPEFKNSITTGRENISQAMYDIYSLVADSTPLTLFFDFLKYFEKIYTLEFVESDKMYRLSREAVDFVTIIKNEVEFLDNKIDSFGMENCNDESYFEEKKNHIEAKKQSIMNRLSKINSEENRKRQEIYEIEDDLDRLKTAEVNSIRNASLALNKLSSAQQKLNSFYGNRAFVRLFELLAFFCGDIPKFDPYGKTLAEDQQLKATIEKRSTVRELSANEEKIAKQIESMYEEYQQLSVYITNLADYALEMATTARTQKQLKIKSEQLEKDKENLIQILDNVRIERDSISELLEEIKGEFEQVDKELADYRKKNSAYTDIVDKRKGMDELMLRIDELSERWFEIGSKQQNSVSRAIRNSFFLSFFLAYGGIRFEFMEEVENIIRRHELYTGRKTALEIIGEILGSIDAEKDQHLSDTNISLKYLIFLQLALNSGRTPLIADDDRFILESIVRIIPKPEQIVCSVKSSTVKRKIIEAAEKGLTMILTDVDELTPQLEKFISIARSADPKQPFVLGTETIFIEQSFKLILIASKHIENIPADLISKVTPIDFNKYNQGFVREVVEKTFIVYYKPQVIVDIMDPIRSIVDERVQMKKAEKELLEVISDIRASQKQDKNYSFSNDFEALSSLHSSKSQFLELLTSTENKIKKAEEVRERRKEILKEYVDPIDITESIWISLSRIISKVSPLFSISFIDYVRGIEAIIKENKILTKLKDEIIKKAEEEVLPSLTIRDGLFFMLITAFFYNCRHGISHERDLLTISRHIYSEYNSKCKKVDMDESRGETFEQLKFVSLLDIYKLCEVLIRDNFDENFYKAFTYDKIPEEGNIVFIKHNGITMQNFESTLGEHQTFTLWPNSEHLAKIRTALTRARKFGGIVVLYYDTPNKEMARFIIDNIDEAVQKTPHSSFKLIISCTSIEYIPKSVLLVSKVVQTRENMSVHHTISNFREVIENSADFHLGYSVGIFFALSLFRGFIKPNGITNENYLTERVIMKVINKIKTKNLTIVEAKKEIKYIIECLFQDPADSAKCIAHLDAIITPEITNDIFSFSRSIEAQNWAIPKKARLCNKMMKNLPIIPPIDTLNVQRNTWTHYEQWSLSRWIAEPFITLISDYMIDADAKISSIAVTLQGKIQEPEDHFDVIMHAILLKEIDVYNNTIDVMKRTLNNPSKELKASIYNDICPKEWMDAIHIKTRTKTATFFKYLSLRKEFIYKLMQGSVPSPIETASCVDLKQLMQYYMEKYYPGMTKEPVFELEFHGKEKEIPLAVNGITLVGWQFDDKNNMLVKPTKDAEPSTKLPTCYLKPMQTLGSATLIPLYSTQNQEQNAGFDQENPEFICNIAIKGKISDEDIIINGVCAILHQSTSFE